jgi:uncharacterized protein RhaS with RHS repeats
MQARYYDPVIGRFYSNDPVGVMGHDSAVHGFNRYAYANNNPYKYTDPTGEIPLVVVAIWILKEAGGEVFEQATGIPAPTIKNLGKTAAKQVMRKALKDRPKVEGVYKFKEGDKDYVGQSKDVLKRLQQHERKGKFDERSAGSLEVKGVQGGKNAREQVEQKVLDKATDGVGAKSDKVTNKVNPCRRDGC